MGRAAAAGGFSEKPWSAGATPRPEAVNGKDVPSSGFTDLFTMMVAGSSRALVNVQVTSSPWPTVTPRLLA